MSLSLVIYLLPACFATTFSMVTLWIILLHYIYLRMRYFVFKVAQQQHTNRALFIFVYEYGIISLLQTQQHNVQHA